MISSGLRTGIQSKNKKITLLALGFFFMFGYSNVSYLLPVYYAVWDLPPRSQDCLSHPFISPR